MPILGGGASTRAGTVQAWPSNTIPSGWLKCNGAAISRTLYAALFSEIGTTYGAGDGSTTFNLPDLRGEFVRGLDDGRGVDSGRSIGTAQSHQMQSHNHPGQTGAEYKSFGADPTGEAAQGPSGLTYEGRGLTGTTGGTSNSSENRPRNIAMNYIIKF